ncbi:MAG: alpha/beta hydrolase [Panacagrimonas sp.]
MQNIVRSMLRGTLKALFKSLMGQPLPVRLQRAWLGLLSTTTLTAAGTRREQGHWGVSGEWLRHRNSDPRHVLLYLHGGGYTVGSAATHKSITSQLAARARCQVLVPQYRLAPEHPYPAALDDAVAAYRALLDQFDPTCIAVAGDSAGGGLALSTVLALPRMGLPSPAALILLSPWVDLSLSGDSMDTRDAVDPMLGRAWLQRAGDAYRGTLDARDARVSPLFDRLDNVPPLMIQVGSDEVLLSDSQRLAQAATAAGREVCLEIEDGYWHDFQLYAGVLHAADAALERLALFLRRHWAVALTASHHQEHS